MEGKATSTKEERRCDAAVSLAASGRDGRLSRSVRARAFYAVLDLPTAVLACGRDGLEPWICVSCLQSPVLPGYTRVQQVVSGGILESENHPWALDIGFCNLARGVQISANMCETAFRHTIRKREVFQSRDCLLRVVENGAERNDINTS